MTTRTLLAAVKTALFACAFMVRAGLPGDWQTVSLPVNANLNGVAFGPRDGVAVGSGGTILFSHDGRSWERIFHDFGPGDFFSIAYGNGLYVAGGNLNVLMAISPDGVNWTNIQTTGSVHANYGVAFGRGRFVGVGRGTLPVPTNCRLITSTNGIDWEVLVRPTSNTLRAVAFGNGKYVAVGDAGTIIHSDDGVTWSLGNSGVPHTLRSVMFSGWEFLAGGDSSTLLLSTDGSNWTPAAFSAFDVRAFATSGDATAAVGKLGTEGRLQTTSETSNWLGGSLPFAQPLNAIAHAGLGRFVAVGNSGLMLESGAWSSPQNTWLRSTDGSWEEGFWSLGHLPSLHDTGIIFTNAGSKTLIIDSVVVRDYPESLLIRSLTVDAPSGSHNSLLLDSAQLIADWDITVGSNASLLSLSSTLETATLNLNNRAVFGENTRSRVGLAVNIGIVAPAELVLSNGLLFANRLVVGAGARGTVTHIGGTNHADHLLVASGSLYDAVGGTLIANSMGLAFGGQLRLAHGALVSNSDISLAGGTLSISGSHKLGRVTLVIGRGVIDFQSAQATVRFENSAEQPWAEEASLLITNWTPGTDHLFVGADATGLWPGQLARVFFANPSGGTGAYPARITASGEVVPGSMPSVAYSSTSDGLQLAWPQGYQLWTSTNVSGPYEMMTRATSPHAVAFTDPQRFFVIRSVP